MIFLLLILHGLGQIFPRKHCSQFLGLLLLFTHAVIEYTSVLDNISCLILHNRNLLQRVLGTAAGSDNQFQATSVGNLVLCDFSQNSSQQPVIISRFNFPSVSCREASSIMACIWNTLWPRTSHDHGLHIQLHHGDEMWVELKRLL